MSQVQTFARNKAGKLILNPRKLDVQFFQLVHDNMATANLLAAPNGGISVAAGATSGPISFTVGQEGPMEIFYLSHYRRATIALTESFQNSWVTIFDEGAKKNLMNREIHIDTLMGKTIAAPTGTVGIGPHLLAESLFVNPQRVIQMTIRNAPVGGGIVSLDYFPVMHGTRWYAYANPSKSLAAAVERRGARARVSSPYWFTTDGDILTQAAASTANYPLTITADGHFEWWKTMYVSDQDFLLNIFDQRSGRSFSNGPVYCRAGIGTASFPFILPEHTLLQANTQLRLQVTNLAGALTLSAYITLGGRRIYVG